MDMSYFCCHRFLGDTQQNKIMADCEIMEDAIEFAQELEPCYICGRTFLPAPLRKHTRVCERNATKRRKVFDSLKQRIEGTELASFHQQSLLRKHENLPHHPVSVLAPVQPAEVKSNVTRNQTKWKEKHEAFVQAIRAARSVTNMGPRRSIGAVGTMGVTERCPTCDRQFGPKAYDRHVEWCKERKTRVVRSPVSNPAKDRLEARVKYRVPLPNKSRRSLTREKYSGSISQTSLGSVKSCSSLDNKPHMERSLSVRKPKQQSSSTPKPIHQPIIKSKSPVIDKAKSTLRKSRTRGPKVNSVNINDDLAITVSQVDLLGNRFNKNAIAGNRGIPLATNRKEDLYCNYDHKYSARSETQIKYIEDHPHIEIINVSGDHNFDVYTERSEKEFQSPESKESYTIQMIKEPNNTFLKQSDDDDSCFESIKEEKPEQLLNKTYSNIEISNETGDNDKSPLKSNRVNDEEENNNDLSSNKIWNIAEKEFLVSLKNNSETTDQFVAGLQNKFTSTPLQTFENCYADHTGSFIMRSERSDKEMFTFDSSSLVNLDVYYPTTDHCVSETVLNIEESVPREHRELQPIREQVELPLQLLESPGKTPSTTRSKKTQTDREKSSEDSVQILRSRKKSRPKKNRYTVNDVKEFLTDNSRHIEVEIVATESSNDEYYAKCNKKDKRNRPLKIYKSNAQEVVLQGNKCLNTVNHLFARNKVDDVNIVVANKGLREDYTDYDSSRFDDSENYSTYEEENYVEKYAVTTKVSKTKGNRKSKMVTVSETTETKQSVKLPNSRKYVTEEEESFWQKVAKTEYKPFSTKKSVLHDFEDKKIDNPYKPRAYTNAYEESGYALNPANASVNIEIPERQYPNYNPRTQLPPIVKDPSVPKEEYNPFIVAEKQLMELLECDDFKPFNSPNNTPSKNVKSLPANKISNSVKNTKSPKKRASVIEPPNDFQDNTPLMEDNFEMIENFINDNYINADDCKNSKNKNIKSKSAKQNNNNKSGTNDMLSLNSILAERKYSDDMTSIDPNLINENDNLDIPDKLPVDNDSPASCNHEIDHYSVQYDKNISMLEPLVIAKTEINNMKRSVSMQENQPLDDIDFEEFISSFEDDDTFPTLKNFLHHGTKPDSNTPHKKNLKKSTHSLNSSFGKNSQKVDNKKQSLSPLKRSISLSNPVVKARSMKTKQDIQDYLHVREPPGSKKMLEKEKLKPVISPKLLEEPYNQSSYEEFKKYNDGYKRDNHSRPSGDVEDSNSIDDNNSEVERKHTTKFSGDSAYGSLNRKSPMQNRVRNRHGQVYQTQHVAVERSPSSSGSEKSVVIPSKLNTVNHRLSKFCHECGTKYPLDAAKFCIECGVRRLVL